MQSVACSLSLSSHILLSKQKTVVFNCYFYFFIIFFYPSFRYRKLSIITPLLICPSPPPPIYRPVYPLTEIQIPLQAPSDYVLLWCARAPLLQVTNSAYNRVFSTCLSYRELHAVKSLEHKCSLNLKSVWIFSTKYLLESILTVLFRGTLTSSFTIELTGLQQVKLYVSACVSPSIARPSVCPQGYLLLSYSGSSTFFLDHRLFIASKHMSSQRNTFDVCKQELDEKKFQGLLKFGCQNNFLNSVISNLRRICPHTCLPYIWSVNLDLFKRVTEIIIIYSNRLYLSKNTARFFF